MEDVEPAELFATLAEVALRPPLTSERRSVQPSKGDQSVRPAEGRSSQGDTAVGRGWIDDHAVGRWRRHFYREHRCAGGGNGAAVAVRRDRFRSYRESELSCRGRRRSARLR